MSTIVRLLIGILTISTSGWAQQSGTVDDKSIRVLSFEELKYPALGLTARIQGIVVVQAKLDDEGRVTDVVALSGNEILVPSTLANVKRWRFQPNKQRAVVVVFNFTLEPGCYKRDRFKLEGRNLAIITGHASPVEPAD
jgi:TonB family protein